MLNNTTYYHPFVSVRQHSFVHHTLSAPTKCAILIIAIGGYEKFFGGEESYFLDSSVRRQLLLQQESTVSLEEYLLTIGLNSFPQNIRENPTPSEQDQCSSRTAEAEHHRFRLATRVRVVTFEASDCVDTMPESAIIQS